LRSFLLNRLTSTMLSFNLYGIYRSFFFNHKMYWELLSNILEKLYSTKTFILYTKHFKAQNFVISWITFEQKVFLEKWTYRDIPWKANKILCGNIVICEIDTLSKYKIITIFRKFNLISKNEKESCFFSIWKKINLQSILLLLQRYVHFSKDIFRSKVILEILLSAKISFNQWQKL